MYRNYVPVILFLFHLVVTMLFPNPKRLQINYFLQFFAHGMILSMMVVCILPNIFQNCTFVPIICTFLPFILLSLFERISTKNEDVSDAERSAFTKKLNHRQNVIFILAIFLHTFSDTICLADVPDTSMLKFGVGYGIQKSLESSLVAIFIYLTDIKMPIAYSIAYIYALCAPAGMLLGIYIRNHTSINDLNLKCGLTGVSFGLLFFNFVSELLSGGIQHQDILHEKYDRSSILAYGLGFFAMTVAGYSFIILSKL
ncbi:Zinc (Zn2+)-Iron (Fe2+) Permease (ZIP) Family [Trachipleistophora hominis]|uniref:Zinc (Zn2+)-Iron (Fe2+) Permease (ZIP) Family n=1 Tax=Trachipleistophora hominis TaxID=72359 RepID=L7JUE1_TRAHO|nr:Zinc (Zn2+)-Iron (Fe2+) Permease (ZIP) Family [Trachipleistophora hominis]